MSHFCRVLRSRMNPAAALSAVLSAAMFLASCGPQVSYGDIPEVTIGFPVYPYSMDNVLLPIGNYKYFDHGYAGVFVYHIGWPDEEYVAFERACPLDWRDGCRVDFDPETVMLKGTRCGKRFSSSNGYCFDVQGYALRKLRITYQGNDAFRVSN